MMARQIHALAPRRPRPLVAPRDPLWFRAPYGVLGVQATLGGTRADYRRALKQFKADIGTPGLGAPVPWLQYWIQVVFLRFRFRWDPRGPMSWPQVYVFVESYYHRYPEEDIWRGHPEIPDASPDPGGTDLFPSEVRDPVTTSGVRHTRRVDQQ
jgi:hypothetical protein